MEEKKTYQDLLAENENLRQLLDDATDTIEAIRTGQVDALIVKGKDGHELYTLKTADQTYRVFIEKMTEGAVTLNRSGTILYCNSRLAAMVDKPLSRVLGLTFSDFITPDNKEQFKILFDKAWHQDCKGEIQILGKAANIPIQLSLTTLELDEGFSMSVILTDLTVQKENQLKLKLNNEELAAANKALEISNNDLQQFASVASHDLQEPLRKIMIFSDLIKENHSNELAQVSKSYLDKIIFSSYRMKSLIVDILNYSRLSQNNNFFDQIELEPLIQDVLEDFEIIIKEKEAIVTIMPLPIIEANKGQLRQVFQNMISNSLKFSKKDEQLQITIKEVANEGYFDIADNKMRLISIKDNGIGFNNKYNTEIFTLFQRLNTKDKYEGTGIGLAITKKIIDKHNGFIKALSHEGKGAEFILALPVLQKFANAP